MRAMTGKQLYVLRERLGLTREQLGELLGVNRSTIARWEDGERTIPPYLHLALQMIELKQKQKKPVIQ
jgi:transcriptional regulator with XRE-family HTH domain